MRKIKRILFRVRDEPLEKINAPAKARTFITERKGRAFVFDKSRKFIIAKALPDVNTHFQKGGRDFAYF